MRVTAIQLEVRGRSNEATREHVMRLLGRARETILIMLAEICLPAIS